MRASFQVLLSAVLLLGGAAAFGPGPASAQPRWERPVYPSSGFRGPIYRGGAPVYRGRGLYAGPRYDRGAGYYGRGYRGYRPAYYGRRYYGRRYYGGYYPYGYYYRHGYNGGAAVAGLIGGLTLGTIAGAVTGPFYYGPASYGPRCVLERRRVVNRYGRRVWRRIEVCY